MPDRPSLAYLDHAATTPLRPEARAAMLPWLGESFGNPSGAHGIARAARQAIDEARDTIATLLGCAPNEVVFTSGGTEADNLAILGVTAARPGLVVASAIEHHAVLEPLAEVGGRTVGVDRHGLVDLDALADALSAEPPPRSPVPAATPEPGRRPTLVAVMAANNEIGTVQPIAEVAKVVRRCAPDAVLHTDAVQATAWLDIADVAARADLVSVSGHKVGGPQGVGALVVRRGTPLRARAIGGGQERELRSGTHNVAGIVGMAAALAAKADRRAAETARVTALRDALADGLASRVPDLFETAAPDGDRSHLLPGTVHVTIPGVESEALLFLLDEAGVCASAAAACASGAQQASHVLAALGLPPDPTAGTLRLSLGWTSTDADVDRALDVVPAAVGKLRAASRRFAPTAGAVPAPAPAGEVQADAATTEAAQTGTAPAGAVQAATAGIGVAQTGDVQAAAGIGVAQTGTAPAGAVQAAAGIGVAQAGPVQAATAATREVQLGAVQAATAGTGVAQAGAVPGLAGTGEVQADAATPGAAAAAGTSAAGHERGPAAGGGVP